jgi:FkbM family methyltransferase
MRLISRILAKTYKYWSSILPSFYRAYKLPTGGNVYLDITESPAMFARVIGKYETQKHRALDFFLAKGDAYIDIGANKGEFAIHAALAVGEKGSVLAFEPEPENCKWIRRSIDKSNIQNIVLEQAAVGKAEGSLKLFIGEKSGWHSLVNSEQNLKKESITVSVCSLDNYLEKNPVANLRAIKIDVEGFEREVLLGASKTLNQYNDLIVLVDIHPGHGVRHNEIYDILHGHGFSLYKEEFPFNLPLDETATLLEVVAVKTAPLC